MSDFILQNSKFFSSWIVVLLSSMLPIVELRGAIPIGIALKLNPLVTTLLAIVGSTIPVPIIFFTIRPILNYLKNTKLLGKKIDKFLAKTMRKSDQITKYGFWGLLIFVGIPLPGTGAWTGTLIAVLLDLRFKSTILAVFLGNIMAGTIIFVISNLAIFSIKFF